MKSRLNTTRWLGLVLAGSILTLAASGQAGKPVKPPKPPPEPTLTYTLVPFDTGPWLGSAARGITEAGLVVGSGDYEYVWEVTNRANLPWPTVATTTDTDSDGVLDAPLPLPVLDGHLNGAAHRANEFGLIVGGTGFPVSGGPPPAGYEQGVVWVPGASGYAAHGVGVIDARLTDSWAGCVNNNGVVAGMCSWDYVGNWWRAYIIVPEETADGLTWFRDDNADGVNDLMLPIWPGPDPALLPGESTPMDPVAEIVAINDDGVVVGSIDNNYGRVEEAVFAIVPDYEDADGDGNPWFAEDAEGYNGLLRGLPPLSAGAYTAPSDINASGEIAGTSDYHAVIWRPDANGAYTIQDLGAFRQRDHLRVSALSDTGWLVGRAYNLGIGASWPKNKPKPALTLVWQDGQMYVLEDILSNGDGWTDLSFSDVSNEGILAGHGTFNGKVTACLAVPNLP